MAGVGADDVVGLMLGSPHDGDAREVEHPADHRNLRLERVRHDLHVGGTRDHLGDPVRLVARDEVHPPLRTPVIVPARNEMRRLVVGGEPGDHVEQAADGVHRRAVGAADRVGHAVEGAEVQRRGVEQHQTMGHD